MRSYLARVEVLCSLWVDFISSELLRLRGVLVAEPARHELYACRLGYTSRVASSVFQ